MGIVVFFVEVVFSAVLFVAMNSHYNKPPPTPKNIAYYDCCDPGLSKEAKENCGFAAKSPENTLIERNGDEKRFVWSNCKISEEPWKK